MLLLHSVSDVCARVCLAGATVENSSARGQSGLSIGQRGSCVRRCGSLVSEQFDSDVVIVWRNRCHHRGCCGTAGDLTWPLDASQVSTR